MLREDVQKILHELGPHPAPDLVDDVELEPAFIRIAGGRRELQVQVVEKRVQALLVQLEVERAGHGGLGIRPGPRPGHRQRDLDAVGGEEQVALIVRAELVVDVQGECGVSGDLQVDVVILDAGSRDALLAGAKLFPWRLGNVFLLGACRWKEKDGNG